jgi:hypothetical protein
MNDSKRKALKLLSGLERLEDRRLLSLGLVAQEISTLQGKQFSGAVAILADTDLTALPTSFTVSIVWQFGQPGTTTSGTVSKTSIPGRFEVDGTFTYPQAGTFTTQITVTDMANQSVTAEGVAKVAAQPLTILGNTIMGTESQPLTDVVANFIDPNPADQQTQFNALIGWGDGASSPGTVQGGSGQFMVVGSHTYTLGGTYSTTITVVGQGNVPGATATGSAIIAPVTPPVITIVGQSVAAPAGQLLNNVAVATITDPVTTDTANQFTALISWGDGVSTQGTVTAGSGTFNVTGSHTYAAPGTFAITVTLGNPGGGSVSSSSTATIVSAGTNVGFTGSLALIPQNGPGASSGFTNTNRPTFSGTAPPFATVELVARPSDVDVTEPLGFAIASGDGTWTLAVGPLSDGIYTMTAIVTPPGGYPSATQPLADNGRVVIDTVAPQVAGFGFSGGRTILVYFRDDLSGMNMNSLMQPSNYTFAGPHLVGVNPVVTGVTPAGTLPTDVVGVSLLIPAGHKTQSRIRGLRITGTNTDNVAGGPNVGITDQAGNPLQGFFGNLIPSASGRTGGNFHVKLRLFHARQHATSTHHPPKHHPPKHHAPAS